MKFAQFQSTYKPLPIETYERTGQELEAKYYRNREQSSLLRQGLANTKVEDRNIQHLAKAVTDVESTLEEVNGKWHYASNALYKAKDRLVNDKVLGASIEDYAKSQASKAEQQKRLEEGKIGQDALSAFYTYDKLYNHKAIEADEQGQLKNRWITPTSPDKPDIDKKAMELVDMVLKNPTSVDTGLMSILDSQGLDTGYLERIRRKEVNADQITGVVKGWLANSDDVKDYYNYINRADLLSKTTQFDETGNTIESSILPTMISEYRNMGWNVDEKGNLIDNYQHYINDRGEFDILKDKDKKSVELKNAPKNIYDDPILKYNINEQKLTAEDALKTTYLSRKLDSQLNSIADGYKKFAFSETSHFDTTANQEHWLKRKMELEREAANAIAYSSVGNVPMYNKNYSIRDAENTYKQLQTEFEKVRDRPGTPEYEQARNALYEQTQNIVTLSSAFGDSPEGQRLIKDQWQFAIKNLPANEQFDLTSKYYNKFVDYLLGKGTLPEKIYNKANVSIPSLPSSGGPLAFLPGTGEVGKSFNSFEAAKIEFQKTIDKKLKDGIAIDNKYRVFKDRDNNLSKFHQQEGEFIKENGNSYILPQHLDEIGKPIKFQDYLKETLGDKYSTDWFDMEFFPIDNTSTGYGQGVVKFIPNKNFPKDKDIPTFDPIVVRPDASVSREILANRAKYVIDNASDPEAARWATEGLAMTQYGDAFAPLLNSLAGSVKLGASRDLQNDRTIGNVPFGNQNFTMIINPVDTPTGLEYQLFFDQLSLRLNNAPYEANKPIAAGNSIPEMITSLYLKNQALMSNTK